MKPTVSLMITSCSRGSRSRRDVGSSVANMRCSAWTWTLSQRIKKCRLTGVCITDDRDNWQRLPGASLSPFLASLPLTLDLALESVYSIANSASIRFQFCFTRTSSTDAACESRERRILSGDQTRQQVLQLGQLDLNLSFFRLRPLCEDVEDQLRSIDHLKSVASESDLTCAGKSRYQTPTCLHPTEALESTVRRVCPCRALFVDR